MAKKTDATDGRVIKRYPNRKLYDTFDSRYITLVEIADLLREGINIQVQDSRTGEDITSVTLAQVLVGEEKSHRRTVAIHKMAALLHQGGEFIQKKIPVVTTLREEAEKKVQELLKHNSAEEIKEVLINTHHAYEEIQRRADEQIQFVVSTVKSIAPLARDINELKAQVIELSKRVAELEQKAGR